METHGPDLNIKPKCAQIIAAEAYLALNGNEQTIIMLQQTPHHQIKAEEMRLSAAAVVSYLSSTEYYLTHLFRPNQSITHRHSSIIYAPRWNLGMMNTAIIVFSREAGR